MVDQTVLENTLRLIFNRFPNDVIQITEVGIYSGQSGNALKEFCELNGKQCGTTGIDNGKDGEKLLFDYNHLYNGDADEMAYKLEDNSQHLIFLDACHCFAHAISNFFSYAPKVKVGGYLALHDTGRHIHPFKDFQHGDKNNPDAYISVRKALTTIGLFNVKNESFYFDKIEKLKSVGNKEWELIFDESDPNNEAGGITVFKKL